MKQRRSWFALLTFCTTSALVAALALAILFAAVTVVFAVADASGLQAEVTTATPRAAIPPDSKVFVGLITDDHCGARHAMDSDKNPTECARMCVRNGAKYVLVNGDKTYRLEEDGGVDFDKLVGQRLKVTGTLDGDTISIISTTGQ